MLEIMYGHDSMSKEILNPVVCRLWLKSLQLLFFPFFNIHFQIK